MNAHQIGERILGARFISVAPHPSIATAVILEFEHRGTDDDSGYLVVDVECVRFEEDPPR